MDCCWKYYFDVNYCFHIGTIHHPILSAKKKSENEVELQQNFNNLILENNPGYTEANLYEEDISSLPLIDFEQIQKGKLIGNTSCSSFFYVKSLGAKSIYIFH